MTSQPVLVQGAGSWGTALALVLARNHHQVYLWDINLEMIREIKFDKVHSASYSVREGTIASRTMPDDVPFADKKARLKVIDDLQKDIQENVNSKLNGTVQEVLVENIKNDILEGRTKNDKIYV